MKPYELTGLEHLTVERDDLITEGRCLAGENWVIDAVRAEWRGRLAVIVDDGPGGSFRHTIGVIEVFPGEWNELPATRIMSGQRVRTHAVVGGGDVYFRRLVYRRQNIG